MDRLSLQSLKISLQIGKLQGEWAAETVSLLTASSATQSALRVVQIDPFTMMTSQKQLSTEHFADYSFVFN